MIGWDSNQGTHVRWRNQVKMFTIASSKEINWNRSQAHDDPQISGNSSLAMVITSCKLFDIWAEGNRYAASH